MSDTFVLEAGVARYEIRPPSSFRFAIDGPEGERLRQGGFFVPVRVADEVTCVFQFEWEQLTTSERDVLEACRHYETLTLTTPLQIPATCYLEAVESSGVVGRVDEETGEALYRVSLEVRVTHLNFQGYLKPFPDSDDANVGADLGVPTDGVPMARVQGDNAYGLQFRDGWAELLGGNTDPWQDVVPPEGDTWRRDARTFGDPAANARHPNWLAVDPRHLPPVRGTAYLAFRPLPAEGYDEEYPA